MMRYPAHPSQPNEGNLPSMYDIGPPDLRASAHNPRYGVYARAHGRRLGDVEAVTDNADGSVSYESLVGQLRRTTTQDEMRDYPAELNELARLDDIQGNGVFDAPGTHGNIHPDAGIFADRESLPGYLAREQFFKESEVIDVNTGEPVVYVPGNAFMLDPRTEYSLAQRNLYEPGWPGTGGRRVDEVSTWIPDNAAWPIGSTDEKAGEARQPASGMMMFAAAAIAGAAIGLVAGMMTPKRS